MAGSKTVDAPTVQLRALDVGPLWARKGPHPIGPTHPRSQRGPALLWPCLSCLMTPKNEWVLPIETKILEPSAYLPHFPRSKYRKEDTFCNRSFWKSRDMCGFAKSLPISLQPTLRWGRHLSSLWEYRLAFPCSFRVRSSLNQAISPLWNPMCAHSDSSFPAIGFCLNGFLWYRVSSLSFQVIEIQASFSTQGPLRLESGPSGPTRIASPSLLPWIKHLVSPLPNPSSLRVLRFLQWVPVCIRARKTCVHVCVLTPQCNCWLLVLCFACFT